MSDECAELSPSHEIRDFFKELECLAFNAGVRDASCHFLRAETALFNATRMSSAAKSRQALIPEMFAHN